MGATEKLSIPVEETPAVDPTQATQETNETNETQSERAEWLPEKFETAEEGQMAIQEAEVQKIYSEVGGEKAYGDMMQWASETLSPEEVKVYDEAVQSGDQVKVMSAIRGLQARYSQKVGTQPKLVKGNTSGKTTKSITVDKGVITQIK